MCHNVASYEYADLSVTAATAVPCVVPGGTDRLQLN